MLGRKHEVTSGNSDSPAMRHTVPIDLIRKPGSHELVPIEQSLCPWVGLDLGRCQLIGSDQDPALHYTRVEGEPFVLLRGFGLPAQTLTVEGFEFVTVSWFTGFRIHLICCPFTHPNTRSGRTGRRWAVGRAGPRFCPVRRIPLRSKPSDGNRSICRRQWPRPPACSLPRCGRKLAASFLRPGPWPPQPPPARPSTLQ